MKFFNFIFLSTILVSCIKYTSHSGGSNSNVSEYLPQSLTQDLNVKCAIIYDSIFALDPALNLSIAFTEFKVPVVRNRAASNCSNKISFFEDQPDVIDSIVRTADYINIDTFDGYGMYIPFNSEKKQFVSETIELSEYKCSMITLYKAGIITETSKIKLREMYIFTGECEF